MSIEHGSIEKSEKQRCDIVVFEVMSVIESKIKMVVRIFFFFKQKTAYEVKECDWSSDVCSSDLSQRKDFFGRVYAF